MGSIKTRRGVTRVLAGAGAAGLLLVMWSGLAQAEQAPVSITNNWELLADSYTGLVTSKTIPIDRGVLPGGTSGLNPSPDATLEVVGRHTNGTPGSSWRIAVQNELGVNLAEVTLPATAATFAVRSTTLSWPALDTTLAKVQVTRVNGTGVAGTLDLRKVGLRLIQTGTIQATQARFPMGTLTENITATAWTDLADGARYIFPEDDEEENAPAFDPAPAVRFRASGSPCGLELRLVRAVDSDDDGDEDSIDPVADSQIAFTNAGGPVESAALSLVKGGLYRTQARKSLCTGAAPTGTVTSLDLVMSQSTSDPDGIVRTVGYYNSVSDGVDVGLTNSNQPLDFRFRAPLADVPRTTQAFAVTAVKTSGTGSFTYKMRNHTRDAPVDLGDTSFQLNNPTGEVSAVEVTTLPIAGDELDTVIDAGTGTVHAWSTYLQVNMRLADIDAPEILEAFKATQPPGTEEGRVSRRLDSLDDVLIPGFAAVIPDSFL